MLEILNVPPLNIASVNFPLFAASCKTAKSLVISRILFRFTFFITGTISPDGVSMAIPGVIGVVIGVLWGIERRLLVLITGAERVERGV